MLLKIHLACMGLNANKGTVNGKMLKDDVTA